MTGKGFGAHIKHLILRMCVLWFFLSPICAQDLVQPSVPPGVYNAPQILSFSLGKDVRLQVVTGDTSLSYSGQSILLDADEGTVNRYNMTLRVFGIEPDSPLLEETVLKWTVDRKPPLAPSYFPTEAQNGYNVRLSIDEEGLIYWRMYHPFYRSSASGETVSGNDIFVPRGAVVCAWGRDTAGNAGRVSSWEAFGHQQAASVVPVRVINPVPGEWANRQTLVIEHNPLWTVTYSLDGSDPAISGIVYDGPILLDLQGLVALRLHAAQGNRTWSERIVFTVSEAPPPIALAPDASSGIIEVGEFLELQIPPSLSFGIDDPSPYIPGGRSVLFTAMRGLGRLYPLAVSDRTNRWRWVLSSGNEAVPDDKPATTTRGLSVHDWYFFSFDDPDTVIFRIDNGQWQRYSTPVFIDRASDSSLQWYSPSRDKGAVHTVPFPAKPSLRGIPSQSSSFDPVFISVDDKRWKVYYRLSGKDDADSVLLGDGLLVETPAFSSTVFDLDFDVYHDSLYHGSLRTRFELDRKPPRIPFVGVPPSFTFSRTPVILEPAGEDEVVIAIDPPLFSRDGNAYILHGQSDRAVDYTVSVFSRDAAGNVSPKRVQKIRVDIHALFVGQGKTSGVAGDGTPDNPYTSLDEAFDQIRDRSSWRIYLVSDTRLSRAHTVQSDVRLIGGDHTVLASADAFLFVSGGKLSLENCTLSRTAVVETERPFIDAVRSSVAIHNSSVLDTGCSRSVLIRASDSGLIVGNSRLSVSALAHAIGIDARSSSVTITASTLTVTSRTLAVISLNSVRFHMTDSTVQVSPRIAGRAIEAWNSELSLSKSQLIRKPESASRRIQDAAIWYDASSTIERLEQIAFSGFAHEQGTVKQ